jgi:hypothetical protein
MKGSIFKGVLRLLEGVFEFEVPNYGWLINCKPTRGPNHLQSPSRAESTRCEPTKADCCIPIAKPGYSAGFIGVSSPSVVALGHITFQR